MATAAKNTPKTVDEVTQLHKILEGFEDAILMTKRSDGTEHLHGRPMRIQAVEEDHSVWFFTSVDGQIAHEALIDTEAYITAQSDARHVVLRGWIAITRDRARIDKYWSKMVEVWFPEGKNDPNLCLVKFTPREGEFWDMKGTKGIRYWVDAAKSLVGQTTPTAQKDQHGRVVL